MSTLRIRSIHHDALRSRKLAQLTAEAERCWWRLQCVCDDDGRSEDEPDVLTSILFQVMRDVTPEQVDGWLEEMHKVGLIVRYEVAGKRCFHVVGWHEKQHPRRPQTSRLPAPPSPSVASRPSPSDPVATSPDKSVAVPQEGLGRGEERRRGEGECEGEGWRAPNGSRPLDAYRDAREVIDEHRVPPEDVAPMPDHLLRRQRLS